MVLPAGADKIIAATLALGAREPVHPGQLVTVTGADIKTLKHGVWLNDEVGGNAL